MRDAEAEEALAKRHRKIGEFVDALPVGGAWLQGSAGRVTALRVRFPTEEDPSTLLVVSAVKGGGAVVGFVGAYTLGDALLAMRARLMKGSMKWKEDRPWDER